ncbi:MAG: ABC transporter permease [Cellvibrionales bacterium]|nr:ABC transporter permease [Cellvibrionales bacterium]
METPPRTGLPKPRPSLRRWVAEHRDASLDSLAQLLAAPLQNALTVVAVAVALSLPASVHLAAKNADQVTASWQRGTEIAVYFHPGTATADTERVHAAVLELPGVRTAHLISAEQVLAEFQAHSGLGDSLANFGDNPLPATLLVSPREEADIERLLAQIGQFEAVDQLAYDQTWRQRLQALLDLGRRFILAITLLLSLSAALIIGNTLRLEIARRRDAIALLQMLGATHAYARRPLLYIGIWYGLAGALLAWFAAHLLAGMLGAALGPLTTLYASDFAPTGPNLRDLLALLALGAVLGLLGAWLAATQYLRERE